MAECPDCGTRSKNMGGVMGTLQYCPDCLQYLTSEVLG